MNASYLRWLAAFAVVTTATSLPAQPKPLKALWFSGGGYHDYARQVPLLSSNLAREVAISFEFSDNLDRLKDPAFAKGYDVVVYDFCFSDVEPARLENMLRTLREGKPAVMIHCAVHAFRNSPQVHEWENAVGMRSKVHDRFEPFQTEKVDAGNPVLQGFPDHWKTSGDELYQTIELLPDSHPLLKAKSPQDGRVHTVCWTHSYGQGRVFATTLGHDLHTSTSPDYIRLLSRGLLWACGRSDLSLGGAHPGDAAP